MRQTMKQAIVAVAILLAATTGAQAVSYTWDGGPDGVGPFDGTDWNTPANWVGDSGFPRAIDDEARVPNAAGAVDLSADVTITTFSIINATNTALVISSSTPTTLTFEASTGTAVIAPNNKNLDLHPNVVLKSDLLVRNIAGGSLEFLGRLIGSKDIHIAPDTSFGDPRFRLGNADLSGFTGDIHLRAQTTAGQYAIMFTGQLTAGELLNTTIYMGQDSALDSDRDGGGVIASNIVLQGDAFFWKDGNRGGFSATGVISGPGGLTMHLANGGGGSRFTLSGASPNTFTGDVILDSTNADPANRGFVNLEKDGALGMAPHLTVAANTTIDIRSSGGAEDRIWDGAAVYLEYDAINYGMLQLGAGVDETVSELFLDGVAQTSGTYGSMASAAANQSDEYFSGAGILTVVPPPPPLAVDLDPAGAAGVVANDVFVITATASNATTYTMSWTFEPASAPGTTATIVGLIVNRTDGASSVSVLTLNPVTADHLGTYTIVAEDGAKGTTASAKLVLTLLPPVAISVLPPSASILEGTVDFVATATASLGKQPYRSMSWTKDGAPVNSGDFGGRLSINTVLVSVGDLVAGVSELRLSGLLKANNDAGLYECVVFDDTGTSAIAGSRLYVRDVNDIFVQVDPAWDQVSSGSVYVVTGTASSGTPPYTSMGWSKDGIPLVSGGKLLIETSVDKSVSTLTLTGVSQAVDAGYYLCEAVDSSGTTGTAIAILVVGDILRLLSDNPAATLVSDETYVVTATATGGSLPYASFEWTDPNGDPIVAGVVTVGNQSTLTIVGAQDSDSGIYTCTVTDDDGVAVSVESTLTVGENKQARARHWELLD